MQILTGSILKSVTVQHIMNNSNSYCYVYYTMPLPLEESCFVDSKYTSLFKLISYIELNYIRDKTECDMKDYFIVYTNNTKSEIQELIDWLDNNSHRLNAKCVFVTCRPEEEV